MKSEKYIEDLCWRIFEKSGKIPDYLLYKNVSNLKEQKEEMNYGQFDNYKSNRSEDDTLSR